MPVRNLIIAFACSLVSAMAATAVADPLRYDVQPGKVVAYKVTITAETPSSIETMKGIFALTGKKAERQTMTVEYKGGLQKSVKSKSSRSGPRRGPFGRRPGGAIDSAGTVRAGQLSWPDAVNEYVDADWYGRH